MRFATALSVALTGLSMLVAPTAQAEPTPDDIYSKWLSVYSVSY